MSLLQLAPANHTSDKPAAVNHQSQLDSRRPRKRARVACHLCHARKVRCDVSVVGTPCTNCRLDAHSCSTRPLTARGKRRVDFERVPSPPSSAQDQLLSLRDLNASDAATPVGQGINSPESPAGSLYLDHELFSLFRDRNVDSSKRKIHDLFSSQASPVPQPTGSYRFPLPQDLAFNATITFSYYRFLKLDRLSNIPPDDVRFLEMKGCLHVPSSTHLDQFIRQYFLHVHPCMPILDEAEFWHIYAGNWDGDKSRGISLVVFQAMLFAASTYVPLSVLKACGFQSFYTAREAFHQRARLLYNLEAEVDLIAVSQASLLLSFQSTPHDLQLNTSWLSIAIHNARAANSHLYYCLPDLTDWQRWEKKRLWWCCILRDRIIALGVRRHIQITQNHFDFEQQCVSESEFSGEIERSQVYNRDTKLRLVQIFILQCQLAAALTSTINLIYPLNGVIVPTIPNTSCFSNRFTQIDKSKVALTNWLEKARTEYALVSEEDESLHESVTLYSDITFIYYFSAQLALCHYIVLISTEYHTLSANYVEQLKTSRLELEHATIGITKRVQSLVSKGQVCHLPISIAAYTALPFILLSLDVKLSVTESQKLKRTYRLNAYVEMMRHYGQRYDFTKVISDTIIKLLQSVDIKHLSNRVPAQKKSSEAEFQLSKQSHPRSWSDIVTRNPQLYFKLSVSLDYSLSKGRYPCDSELPSWINRLSANPKEVAIEHVASEPIANLAGTSPEVCLHGDMSFLCNKEALNGSQAYSIHEAISLPENWISASFSDRTSYHGHDMLELLASNDFVLGEHFEHNEDHDANELSFDMFSDDPLEVTPGNLSR
ncbi:hypothetical protein BGZ60DRAFT_107588 [Tricladium varicosporioides]|nr:hypothetical protein BGZ60DRAFT_107588 [Hymenoscyphus varicosporioides]